MTETKEMSLETSETSESSTEHVRSDIHLAAWRRYRVRYALSEPFIWQEAQSRMLSRLDILTVQPQHILDAAPRAGSGALALAARYPKSLVVGHCASRFATQLLKGKYTGILPQRLWRAWLGKPEARIAWTQVVPDAAYDLIVCNLALSWVSNPVEQLRFWAKQLAPGGVLLFSALGPDTASGFRAACEKSGWTTPTAPDFVDMHDYGDMMVQAGLTTPVIDVERLELTYTSAQALKKDTFGLMGNLHPNRRAGLGGKGQFKALEQQLNSELPIRLGLELVFGHAFKPLASSAQANKTLQPQRINLDSLRSGIGATPRSE